MYDVVDYITHYRQKPFADKIWTPFDGNSFKTVRFYKKIETSCLSILKKTGFFVSLSSYYYDVNFLTISNSEKVILS